MQRKRLAVFITVLTLAWAWHGCDDSKKSDEKSNDDSDIGDSDSSPESFGDLEIFSWWTAPGEADALNALLGVYRAEYPNVEIVDLSAAAGGGEASWAMAIKRIEEEGSPPDVIQIASHLSDLMGNLDGGPSIEQLDDLYEEEGWNDKFPELILEAVTLDDHRWAVPIGAHRKNTLLYNTRIVDDPPETLDEFFDLADALQADGITPLALGTVDQFPLAFLFIEVMMGTLGNIEDIETVMTGAADMTDPDNVALVEQSVSNFVRLLSYTNADSAELTWDQAAELLYNEEAAMYMHPDWAKGYLTSLGWMPGVDFDVVPAPGTAGVFEYTVDIFVMGRNSPNPENAVNFLKIVGSAEGQAAFNPIKGSTPVNEDVDVSEWDDTAAANSYADFMDAELLLSGVSGIYSPLMLGSFTVIVPLYYGEITEQEAVEALVNSYIPAEE